MQIARCEWDPSLEGKSMGDILRERGLESNTDNGATLALELQEKGGFGGVFHAMHEEDVRRIMAHPRTMISSDGGVVAPGEGVPHPRNYATFSRVLSLYVREAGLLSLEEAIRKMSSFPAERLSLDGRGVIEEGSSPTSPSSTPRPWRNTPNSAIRTTTPAVRSMCWCRESSCFRTGK